VEGNRILRPAPPVVSTVGHRRLDGTLILGASRLHTRRTHMSMSERFNPPRLAHRSVLLRPLSLTLSKDLGTLSLRLCSD